MEVFLKTALEVRVLVPQASERESARKDWKNGTELERFEDEIEIPEFALEGVFAVRGVGQDS